MDELSTKSESTLRFLSMLLLGDTLVVLNSGESMLPLYFGSLILLSIGESLSKKGFASIVSGFFISGVTDFLGVTSCLSSSPTLVSGASYKAFLSLFSTVFVSSILLGLKELENVAPFLSFPPLDEPELVSFVGYEE